MNRALVLVTGLTLCSVVSVVAIVSSAGASGVIKRPAAAALAGKVQKRPAAATPGAAPAPSADPPPAGGLTAADTQALLAAQNTVRAEVGVGPLAWDATLETFARNHVKTLAGTCTLVHSGGPHGENLASWTGPAGVTQAVTLWASEKSKYSGAGGPYAGPADGAGHYTQIIWAATTKVGCARVTCHSNGMATSIVSCNYSPRGNVMGERVY